MCEGGGKASINLIFPHSHSDYDRAICARCSSDGPILESDRDAALSHVIKANFDFECICITIAKSKSEAEGSQGGSHLDKHRDLDACVWNGTVNTEQHISFEALEIPR
jgi:hypothetical protein